MLLVWHLLVQILGQLPSLSGKSVAITGCTTGLGYYLALMAARKGAKARGVGECRLQTLMTWLEDSPFLAISMCRCYLQVLLLNRASERAVECEKALAAQGSVRTVHCDLVARGGGTGGGAGELLAWKGGLGRVGLECRRHGLERRAHRPPDPKRP